MYNILTNTHDSFDSLEAAKELKQKIINEKVQEKFEETVGLCGLTVVNINEDGNEVWVPVHNEGVFYMEVPKDG